MSRHRLNLLFAVHGYKPAHRVGGPIVSVSGLAEGLVRLGHRVTVVTTNANLDEDLEVECEVPHQIDNVEVWYFSRREPVSRLLSAIPYMSQSTGYLYCATLRPWLQGRINQFDIAHTHLPFVYPTVAVARAAVSAGVPLVYAQRGNFDPERLRFRALKKWAYLAIVERPLIRKATLLHALSDREVETFHAIAGDVRSAVIPNGISAPPRSSYSGRAQSVRERLGIEIVPYILCLSRLHSTKGHERVIEMFGAVAKRIPHSVVFAGPDEHLIWPRLRNQANDMGLGSRVHYAGMLEGDEKWDLLASADASVLLSDAEGLSMSLLESLAVGVPLIVSPGCHMKREVNAGAAIEVDGSDDFASVVFMLGVAENRNRMANAASAAARRYSWESVCTRMEEEYERIMESHGRRG